MSDIQELPSGTSRFLSSLSRFKATAPHDISTAYTQVSPNCAWIFCAQEISLEIFIMLPIRAGATRCSTFLRSASSYVMTPSTLASLVSPIFLTASPATFGRPVVCALCPFGLPWERQDGMHNPVVDEFPPVPACRSAHFLALHAIHSSHVTGSSEVKAELAGTSRSQTVQRSRIPGWT